MVTCPDSVSRCIVVMLGCFFEPFPSLDLINQNVAGLVTV